MQLSMYRSMQVYKYALIINASMQLYKHESIYKCKYVCMQVWKYASMQVFMYASMDACNVLSRYCQVIPDVAKFSILV